MTNQEIIKQMGIVVGCSIRLLNIANHPELTGVTGKVQKITSTGQLQGTWGARSIVPTIDKFEKVKVKL